MAQAEPKKQAKSKAKESDVQALNNEDERAFQRRSVLWPGKIIVGKHELSCQVWNLSLGGARVRIDLPIQEGTAVKLYIEGRGELPAKVAWGKGDSLGLTFLAAPNVVRRMFKDRLHVLGLDETPKS